MDFSKLRSGAVDFAVFLTGHLITLGVTLYSLWLLLGEDLNAAAQRSAELAVARLEDPTIAAFLDAYSLRSLIPALAVFIVIFVLHVHQRGLHAIGRYTPPEIVWDQVPALREWDAMQWLMIQQRLGGDLEYDEVRRLLVRRYESLFSKRWPEISRLTDAFDVLKALALVNVVLFLVGLFVHRNGGANLLLGALFAALAAATVVVAAYHHANNSRWTLREAVEQVADESAAARASTYIPDFSSAEVQRRKREADEIAVRHQIRSMLGFGWSLPVVGSLSIVRQTWRDARFRRELREMQARHKADTEARSRPTE